MNDMLANVDWMSTIKPDDDDYVAAHIDWLKTATPEDWHRTVLDFNWSNRLEPLLWIVVQNDCDMATALTLFWKCEPGWDLMLMARGEKVYERDEAAIIKVIADRINAGSYKRRKIAFDAEPGMRGDYAEMEGYCAQIAEPPFNLHPDMIRSIRGREVMNDAAFYDRCPEDFHGSVMVELPEWDGVTPNMAVAAKELRSVLFNLAIVGMAAGLVPIIPWRGTWFLILGAVMLAGGLALNLRQVGSSTAIVRSLMRENGTVPSRVWEVVTGLAAIVCGALLLRLAFKGYGLAIEASGLSDPSGYGKSVAAVIASGVVWGLCWLASRHLATKVLFR